MHISLYTFSSPFAKTELAQLFLRIITIAAVLGLSSCETLENSQWSDSQSLRAQKQRILDFAAEGDCGSKSACRFVGLGSKPCGGPWEYLVYPTTVDTVRLTVMVGDYNAAEDAYNKKWGIASDCSMASPPDSLGCIDGKCVGYYGGNPKP